MKKCDIIIPVWDELDATRSCIDSLKKYTRYPYRLIIIDNGSRRPTAQYLENLRASFPDFLLIRNDTNLGFVKAVNQGMDSSSNPYVLLLNNDTFVTDNWLVLLIETVESGPENIGMANPTSNVFGESSADGERGAWQELGSCKGFCMLIKRELMQKIGFFDEIYGMGYFEEKDFSRRAIEAGYICVRAKAPFVFHKDRMTFDRLKERDEIFRRNERIYDERWGRPLNIAFAAREKKEFERDRESIYKLLDRGHRVHLFFSKKNKDANFKDHINIKYFSLADLFFEYSVLFKLWERRRKKKIELIFTKNDTAFKFFNRFRFLHKAEVKKDE